MLLKALVFLTTSILGQLLEASLVNKQHGLNAVNVLKDIKANFVNYVWLDIIMKTMADHLPDVFLVVVIITLTFVMPSLENVIANTILMDIIVINVLKAFMAMPWQVHLMIVKLVLVQMEELVWKYLVAMKAHFALNVHPDVPDPDVKNVRMGTTVILWVKMDLSDLVKSANVTRMWIAMPLVIVIVSLENVWDVLTIRMDSIVKDASLVFLGMHWHWKNRVIHQVANLANVIPLVPISMTILICQFVMDSLEIVAVNHMLLEEIVTNVLMDISILTVDR
jgi:hypothetical protein